MASWQVMTRKGKRDEEGGESGTSRKERRRPRDVIPSDLLAKNVGKILSPHTHTHSTFTIMAILYG